MSKLTNPVQSSVKHLLDSKSLTSAKQQADSMAAGVSREFSHFISDIEDLLKETATLSGDELSRANAVINARVNAAKASLDGFGDSVADQLRKSSALTNEYVHEQPWKVIGVAAAAAFAFGWLFTRQR